MKLKIIISLILATFSINSAVASAQSDDQNLEQSYLSTEIDGIRVPFDILIYAQLKYQGHAITHVKKVPFNQEEIYEIRIDRDDRINDFDSIMMTFDMQWGLIEEKKMVPPPPLIIPEENTDEDKPKPKEQPKEDEKENTSDNPENRRTSEPITEEEEVPPSGSGGDGGSGTDPSEGTTEDTSSGTSG